MSLRTVTTTNALFNAMLWPHTLTTLTMLVTIEISPTACRRCSQYNITLKDLRLLIRSNRRRLRAKLLVRCSLLMSKARHHLTGFRFNLACRITSSFVWFSACVCRWVGAGVCDPSVAFRFNHNICMANLISL